MERRVAGPQGPSDKELLYGIIHRNDLFCLKFIGPPGTGKTTAAALVASEYLGIPVGELKNSGMYHIYNCSGEMGVKVVIEEVAPLAASPTETNKRRIIVFEEASGMTRQSQEALKETVEVCAPYCIFIFLMNEERELNDAIDSRCTIFYFNKISFDEFKIWLGETCVELGIEMAGDIPQKLYNTYGGDLRSCISDCLTRFRGMRITQWTPDVTYAQEIFNAQDPVQKYLELGAKYYINPYKLLHDLLILNGYKNSQIFSENVSRIYREPMIPVIDVLSRGLVKNVPNK